MLSSTRCWTAIAILASVLLVATSTSTALSSTAPIAVAAPNDRAATQALLEADYRLAKAILVHFGATEAALARAAKTLGDECKGVLRGGPDESVLEEEGPSASRPRLSGRAQGELARSELEKQTIDVEISERFSAATDRVLRRPYKAYVRVVASLVWSNPTINAVLRERMARLREDIVGHTVSVCADMRAWAASGFHVLPPASKRLEEARQARNQPPAQGNLHSLLQPYEDATGRKILQRETAVEERLRERERDDEVYARADYQMKRALGEKVSSFQQQQFAPVIARGRTSAGTTFVIRANVGKDHTHSCKHEVDVEVIEHDGSSGGSVCISEGAHSHPSSSCSGSVETLELATPPDVRAARFRLGDGHAVTVPVVQIPAKYGGPAGVIIDAFGGYTRHPVSLQELSASGKIIRTVDLKRTRCTKQSMNEGPGPPQFVTLTTASTPSGQPLVIQATLMHFRGQTEFSLGPPPGMRSSELGEEQGTSKQFQWSISTECEPHRYTLIDGILTPPGASVLVRTPSGLAALTKVELAASIHAPGPLFYGVYTTPPTEIIVERPDGMVLYTESLAAKATEDTEYCEGYAEP